MSLASYLNLCKPKIVLLLTLTAFVGMLISVKFYDNFLAGLASLLGFSFLPKSIFLGESNDTSNDNPNDCSKFNFGKPKINGINQFHNKHNGILNAKPTTKNIIAEINNMLNVGYTISQYILILFIKPLHNKFFNIHTNHSN